MLPFRRTFVLGSVSLLMLAATEGHAQNQTSAQKFLASSSAGGLQAFWPFTEFSVTVSYLSWSEKVSLTNGAATDHTQSSFVGNSASFEMHHHFSPHLGWAVQGSFMGGLASIGDGQTTLTYQNYSLNWWGVGASARFSYRFSNWTCVALGPIAMYRNVPIPVDPSGTVANSGSFVNVGSTVDVRMRLSKHLELRQEIGFLAINAGTIWSLGLGYKF